MAMAVAGVCSCNHENSDFDSSMEFRWVSRWSQEQTPATAKRPFNNNWRKLARISGGGLFYY